MKTPAAFLDFSMAAMSSTGRPLDFALIKRYKKSFAPSLENLEKGAKQAYKRFPTSNSILVNTNWSEINGAYPKIHLSAAQTQEHCDSLVEQFINTKLNLTEEAPIKQLFIQESDGSCTLVTRMHHAVGDLLSLVMWLETQFSGLDFQTPNKDKDIEFKTCTRKTSKSIYSHIGPSESLWSENNLPSANRRWKTLQFSAEKLRFIAHKIQKFTYNDILCTAALVSAKKWNEQHGKTTQRVSVWLPVNVRKNMLRGFGNGTSRVRIYSKTNGKNFAEDCALTREQVNWSKTNGEWVFPQSSFITKLPTRLSTLVLKTYFNRPWVDMSTILFSHAEKLTDGTPLEFTSGLENMECVANLHKKYPLVIAGTTDKDITRLTFTYDPALLSDEHVTEFIHIYTQLLENLSA